MKNKITMAIIFSGISTFSMSEDYLVVVGTEYNNYNIEESVVVPEVSSNCQDILDNNPSASDGNYTITTQDGDTSVLCDMTTDGGGWTLVSRIPSGTEIVESSSSINDLQSTFGSMALIHFNENNPSDILFKNTAPTDDYGNNDLIIVSRTTENWNWTPTNYNNNTDQTSRFYDASTSQWSNLGTTTYACHYGIPWQNSPFSFTINGEQDGYSGVHENRLVLGSTFVSYAGGGVFYNFYGNPASLAGYWNNLGQGEIWMR